MSNTREDVCARDGCWFRTELVLVANMPLPTAHCSDACRDFDWLRRGLDALDLTPDVAALYTNLRAVADALDARQDPTDVGPLPGVWNAGS
ncbi:hypothetical protein [Streptomyces sp. NPDC014734]|uniref:hypothetical protein n=1 Tax=Streptomyces sp. NPDC014734 TaxID=3364886 RepID=UPI0037027734